MFWGYLNYRRWQLYLVYWMVYYKINTINIGLKIEDPKVNVVIQLQIFHCECEDRQECNEAFDDLIG